MTDAKFTPGPWVIKNDYNICGPLGGDSGDGVKCDPNARWQVAEVDEYSSFEEGHSISLGSEVCRANAYLMKTAPKMYEALRCLRDGEGLPPGTTIDNLLAEARGEKP